MALRSSSTLMTRTTTDRLVQHHLHYLLDRIRPSYAPGLQEDEGD
jgi:hypothetical protein